MKPICTQVMGHETARSTSSNMSPSKLIHIGPLVNRALILCAVCRWTTFAKNVTATANHIFGTNVPLQGAAFIGSSHSNTGFSPQAIFQNGILSSPAGSQITMCVIAAHLVKPFHSPCFVPTLFLFIGSRSTTTAARFAAATVAPCKISCQRPTSGAISSRSLKTSRR